MKFMRLTVCITIAFGTTQAAAECAAGMYVNQSQCVSNAFWRNPNDMSHTEGCSLYGDDMLNGLYCVDDWACRDCCECRDKCAGRDGPCVPCAANTYNADVGNGGCTPCPTGTTSTLGSTSCVVGEALCNPGYTGPPSGPCTPCVAGTYKAVPGTSACISCVPGKSSAALAASSSTTCQACSAATVTCSGNCACGGESAGAHSGEISVAWPYPDYADCAWLITSTVGTVITLKFTHVDAEATFDFLFVDTCTSPSECAYGLSVLTGEFSSNQVSTYTSETGYLQVRLTSDYSWGGSFAASWSLSTCVPCNAGYIGPDGGPCMACVAGTYANGDTCSSCGPGTYQDRANQPECIACAAGTYSASVAATACVPCPPSTQSPRMSVSVAACTCAVGWGSTSS